MTKPRALVYCEGLFATPSGKTAHGLVRYSSKYDVVAVVDSALAGRDAGDVLDGRACGIPIVRDLRHGLSLRPDVLVLGVATDGGRLPHAFRADVYAAVEAGLHVVAGLHEKLRDDANLVALARRHGVRLEDVRTGPPREESRFFTGKIDEVDCPVVAVLGTDSAIGKRTTARVLVEGLKARGLRAVFVGTGQTARLQGAEYSIILDSIVNDFVTGEIEHVVHEAWRNERPDVIVVEGQGSITHPAYPGGFEILAAARPKAVVLQHAPARKTLDGFPQYPMPKLEREVQIVELLAERPVVAITVNHEGMTPERTHAWMHETERKHGRVVTDVLLEGPDRLVDALVKHFELKPRPQG